MERTKKKTDKGKKLEDTDDVIVTKEQDILRKKVTNLMKKQKLHLVRKIVRGQDDTRPWGQDAQAKVYNFFGSVKPYTYYSSIFFSYRTILPFC